MAYIVNQNLCKLSENELFISWYFVKMVQDRPSTGTDRNFGLFTKTQQQENM